MQRIEIQIDRQIFSGRKSDERRATRYIEHLEAGRDWQALGGKRLQHDRAIISIPVGRRFRITLDTRTGKGQVQTHESYSRRRRPR